MDQKDFESVPAGQPDRFDRAGVNTQAAQAAPPSPTLPEGWTEADVRFLLHALEKGPLLVADTKLGLPSIHGNFGAEVEHCGFGLMEVKGAGYTLSFDAGGAMQRTPSGHGWTRLYIEGAYAYDSSAVGAKLLAYLARAAASPAPLVEPPGEILAEKSVEEQVREFRRDLGQFTGTEQWTRYSGLCPHILLLTHGAMYVAEHSGEDGNTAWWLIDAIASYQAEAVFKHQDFQVWKLVIHPPDEAGSARDTRGAVLQAKPGQAREKQFDPHRRATLICTDGNEDELVRQEIDWTDFLPVGEITLYASVEAHPDISTRQKVMIILLPSEY